MARMNIAMLFLIFIANAALAQPYAVGHRTITLVDSTRGNRNVSTEVYYPAETGGENTAVAVPPAGGFPVISFGHGFLLPTSVYQYLWNAVVPRGFIFALPNTEGNFSPSHQQFGLDLAFVIRKLQREGANMGSPFYSAVGANSCVMGHSMGGGASFLAIASDSCITAVANLAAAETNPSAIAAAANCNAPALIFSASGDCVTPPVDHQVPMYEAMASDCKTFVSITGGSHCKFGENNFTCNLGELTCTGSVTRAVQQQIVVEHLLPYLEYYLSENAQSGCDFQEGLSNGTGITWQRTCLSPEAPRLTVYVNGSEIQLRWSAVPGAYGYELLRGAGADFGYDPLLRVYDGNSTTFTDSPSSNQAFYRVWAK